MNFEKVLLQNNIAIQKGFGLPTGLICAFVTLVLTLLLFVAKLSQSSNERIRANKMRMENDKFFRHPKY